MRVLNLITYTAGAAAVLAVIGLFCGVGWDDPLALVSTGARALAGFAQANLQLTMIVAAIVAAVAAIPGLLMAGAGGGPKDPRRIFAVADRKVAFDRAGNRCEYNGWLWFRCWRPAHHADHFFPHARGGATSMRNLVAACTTCNLAKSAHMPTPLVRRRLERRRRRYFPAGVDVRAGEWFGASR